MKRAKRRERASGGLPAMIPLAVLGAVLAGGLALHVIRPARIALHRLALGRPAPSPGQPQAEPAAPSEDQETQTGPR
ncbi:hypothetical protein C5C21_10815 [Rathayibacter tritici]|nr:hypothetical protein C5C21_10815 [Rathayibacter tritici]